MKRFFSLGGRLACSCFLVLGAGTLSSGVADATPAALPVVKLIATDPVALEGTSSGAMTLLRQPAGTNDLAVGCVIGGTASNGVDYLWLTNVITIPAGHRAVDILIQPIEQGQIGPNKTVTLTLETNANYTLSKHRRATVTIVENRFDDLPPSVTLVAPTNGAVFATPAHVPLIAEATDVDGSVAQVDFFADQQFLGSATNTPYSLVWSNAPPGRHVLFAKVSDELGATALSRTVKITVSNAPPVVRLISPTNGTVVAAPAALTLTAEASDSEDAVANVSFFADERLLGSVTNAPYTLVWSNVPPGRHTLVAKATDVYGLSSRSPAVKIIASNAPPVVSLVSPTNGTIFAWPVNLTLVAEASDSDGGIAKVSFYANQSRLGAVTNPPYSLVWSNVPAGRFTLVAKATDVAGQAVYSAPVKITVSNAPPVVKLTSPTNGAVLVGPTNVTLTAEASDTDDAIVKVSFYANQRLVGALTDAPYSLVWSNVVRGTYTLVATATDEAGLRAVSTPVRLTIQRSTAAQSATNSTPVRLISVERLFSGGCRLTIEGTPGAQVSIQVSHNLVDWTQVGVTVLNSRVSHFIDAVVGDTRHRFYRVIRVNP